MYIKIKTLFGWIFSYILENIKTYNHNYIISGIYTTAKSVEELNSQMGRRLFTIWHDHSTVAGRSHFLVLVSMIYDPLVFLTPEEYNEKHNIR